MTSAKKGNHWLGKFVPYLIYRITGHLNRNLRKNLRRSGINLARWRVLAIVVGVLWAGAVVFGLLATLIL